jgi:ribosomal protein S18 acetylase RimI-like enzyme
MATQPIVTEGDGPKLLNKFSFRPARAEDYNFALALYLESTKPLLISLARWDEEQAFSRFADGFTLQQIRVLSVDGVDIGWIQVSETPEEIRLDQLHLIKEARNQGIGTFLIRELQNRADGSDRALTLNVIRGNRARQLYERLGFRVAGGDEERVRMVWATHRGKAPDGPAA